jgi:hypothetical protein
VSISKVSASETQEIFQIKKTNLPSSICSNPDSAPASAADISQPLAKKALRREVSRKDVKRVPKTQNNNKQNLKLVQY